MDLTLAGSELRLIVEGLAKRVEAGEITVTWEAVRAGEGHSRITFNVVTARPAIVDVELPE